MQVNKIKYRFEGNRVVAEKRGNEIGIRINRKEDRERAGRVTQALYQGLREKSREKYGLEDVHFTWEERDYEWIEGQLLKDEDENIFTYSQSIEILMSAEHLSRQLVRKYTDEEI